MGAQHAAVDDDGITTLDPNLTTTVATHEDGMVIVVLGDGEDEEAFVMDPDYACMLGEHLFRQGSEGKANVERRRQAPPG